MKFDAITIQCPTPLRSQWPVPLAQAWRERHPEIFDEDDLRLALSQSRNHFAEWFVAIHLFQREGALSLVEKYAYLNHARKREVLRRILAPKEITVLEEMRKTCGVQPPDLFVYMPDGSRYWFAEAKGPGDRLSESQRRSHVVIGERLGVPVEVFNVDICGA